MRVPQKRSGRDDCYILDRYLIPVFGDRLPRDITPELVEEYKSARLEHLSPREPYRRVHIEAALASCRGGRRRRKSRSTSFKEG